MKTLAITLSMIVAVAFATSSFAGPRGDASSKMNKAADAVAGGLKG